MKAQLSCVGCSAWLGDIDSMIGEPAEFGRMVELPDFGYSFTLPARHLFVQEAIDFSIGVDITPIHCIA